MYNAQLTWYEQENLRYKAHFRGLAKSTVVFASLRIVSWIEKTLPVGPTVRYAISQNP